MLKIGNKYVKSQQDIKAEISYFAEENLSENTWKFTVYSENFIPEPTMMW